MKFKPIALGLALGISSMGIAHAASKAKFNTVKIIAFNDFHGNLQSPGKFNGVGSGGVDELAGYVAWLKSQNPNSTVVSAGDLVGASPLISALFHDEGTIETMNRVGLEFDAVGNHEFDAGKDELLRKQKGGCYPADSNTCKGASVSTPYPFEGAKFSFLSANVEDKKTHKTLFPPYLIKKFPNGTRVAFIGMTLQGTPAIVTPAGIAGLEFKDEAATVNALIPKIRARGAKAIVVLVHQGGAQTTPTGAPNPPDINGCVGNLAGSELESIVGKLNDGVDLVISGHTHQAYVCPNQLKNKNGKPIPVSSANAFGRVLTNIDMNVDARTGKVVSVTAQNLVVDRSKAEINLNAPDVQAIQKIVGGYSKLVSPIAGGVIGSITQDVNNSKNAACEIPAGDLIADAQLKATQDPKFGGAQIAMMNPGGIRSSAFSYGGGAHDITYGEAFTVQPFGNSLQTMTLSAQQLKDVLEQQFAGCQIAGEPGKQTVNRILQISNGFKFSWDYTLPPCQKIVDVSLGSEAIVSNGKVLNSNTYRVTVNSFMATGGDGYTVFNHGTDRLGGAQDIDALVAYLANFKSPKAAYDPNNPSLNKPRISRLDAGKTCPN